MENEIKKFNVVVILGEVVRQMTMSKSVEMFSSEEECFLCVNSMHPLTSLRDLHTPLVWALLQSPR